MVGFEHPGDGHPAAFDPSTVTRIRAQIQKVIASPLFARSERLSNFLRFSAESTLHGDSEQLKESVIGVKVYDRDPGYDPKLEPIVRTEARRLRAKLKQYYESAGTNDRIVITLPTGGYAIHFEILPDLAAIVASLPVRVAPQSSWKQPVSPAWLLACAAILLVAAGVMTFLYLHAIPSPAPTVTPVATYPGDEFQPSVSPDGKQVAFVWNHLPGRYNIYIKPLDDEKWTRLTASSNPVHDLFPAWSPDGASIAFISIAPGKKNLQIIPASGGAPRQIADFNASLPAWVPDASIMDWSPGPAWSEDGRSLVITDRPPGQTTDSLYLLSPSTGEKRKLTSPRAIDVGDYAPAFSPDARSLAFIRLTSQRGISDIYVLSLRDRTERRITDDAKRVSGVRWLSNRELIFSSNRGGANALWRISSSGGTPRSVFAAGVRATNPTVLPGGRACIYTQAFRNTYIWRVDLADPGGRPIALPRRLIGSQGLNDSAQYSSDGAKIAWISDRSGTREIWIANSDGSNEQQLTRFGGVPVGTPRWSPDGRRIVCDSIHDDKSAIYIVDVATGQRQLFASGAADDMMPSWSRDSRSIYFLSNRDASRLQTFKKPAAGGLETSVTRNGGGEALEPPDTKELYYSRFRGGIWHMLPNGTEAPLSGLADITTSRHIAVISTGIFYLNGEAPPWQICFYRFSTGVSSPVLTLDKPPEFGTPSLSASPDGRSLIFSQLDQSGTDLQLLRNF